MKKLKVMTIVGTRPELIKLSRVMAELDQHTDHILVHSGQNYDYELNEIFFKELQIKKPDHFLDAVGETTAETIGNVIAKSDAVIAKEQPDAVLLYGDTNTCLAAISAKRRKVPVFHMEAGNRCFDDRVPEEINRRILDHISDINLPLTEHARQYLIQEGLKPETVIKSGSTMKEVLTHYQKEIEASDVLARMDLKAGEYFIVSAHREENVDVPENLAELLSAMETIAKHYDKKVVISTHPRTRDRMETFAATANKQFDERLVFMKPFGFFDYIQLQKSAFCVLSDSGTITEESSILNFPGVNLRPAHERPEGMDVGTVVMSGVKADRIIQAIEMVTQHHDANGRTFELVPDYDVDNVSKKVVRIILSYVDYVNRTVWGK